MPTTGITVPGTAGGNIVVSTGTGDYLKLAQQMASALNLASVGSGVSVTTVTAGSFVPTAPSVKGTTELGIVGLGGKSTQVPPGSGWNYVVNVTSSPDTVTASNTQVLSGDQGATILVSGTSSVAATGGNNLVNAAGVYLVSTSTGNDTIFGTGSGTVAAGAGSNFVSVVGNVAATVGGTASTLTGSGNASDILNVTLGGSNNIVFATTSQTTVSITGTNNAVVGGDASSAGTLTVFDSGDFANISAGKDSVLSATVSGNGTHVFGGTGSLTLNAFGANDTVGLGSGNANVSLGGSAAFLFGNNSTGGGNLTLVNASNKSFVSTQQEASATITLSGSNSTVFGGTGTLNMSVSGSGDTVFAGTGAATVQTGSNPLVFGPSGGNLNFVGGAGTPTVVGGKGGTVNATVGSGGIIFSAGVSNNSTVTSGIGQATIFGGSGSVVNFIGTAPGGAQLHAYEGNETLIGSGSTTNNLYYGSSIASATANFVGGTGNDTFYVGDNAETLSGGGGKDTFVFLNQVTSLNGGGAAHITLTDFAQDDTIFMVGYSSAHGGLSNVIATATGPAISGSGTGLTLTLSDNTTVTFSNLTSVTQLAGKIGYFS
jgi:fibronectin-binding autotransporter adhesin